MRYYLAYGSNLNVEQMRWRCPAAEVVDTGVIKNWRLSFKGSLTGSYLTIDKCKGGEVPVAIWAVTEADEVALDRYEGFPTFYHKRDFIIDFAESGERHRCFAYIMRADAKYGIPSAIYMSTCSKGYQHFGFDADVLREAFDFSKEQVFDRVGVA